GRRGLAAKWRLDHRTDDVPDLGPTLARGLAHRPRMLVPGNRAVRVVVQLDELRPPPEKHRRVIAEQEAHHRPERVRPRLDRTDGRRGPIDRSHDGAHFSASRKHPIDIHDSTSLASNPT